MFPSLSTKAINYSPTYLKTIKNIIKHHSSQSLQHILKKVGSFRKLLEYRYAVHSADFTYQFWSFQIKHDEQGDNHTHFLHFVHLFNLYMPNILTLSRTKFDHTFIKDSDPTLQQMLRCLLAKPVHKDQLTVGEILGKWL
jgi:hypothetical protein